MNQGPKLSKRRFLLLTGSVLLLAGCQSENKAIAKEQRPEVIHPNDACHLCGMTIQNFPGPKGQLYERGNNKCLKFCCTRDMFAYWLDPEHRHNIQGAFVHDMSKTHWQKPSDQLYIDARRAIYVVGHNRKGALGPTLASFSNRDASHEFMKNFGGEVYIFSEISEHLI
ncbi:MAG: nitrous oxide reductase accessory protein NosL [Motiliproteus sp.]|nr:nitrous oxide reductase accessory protein NosL [Motiliproteus sp.]MCW9053389.1 nitrous oxide reductase accessory protein NosL [Motiliproteus sp.]